MPSAPTPVLRAHSRRVSSAQSMPGGCVFRHNQKIVAAGVRFGERESIFLRDREPLAWGRSPDATTAPPGAVPCRGGPET